MDTVRVIIIRKLGISDRLIAVERVLGREERRELGVSEIPAGWRHVEVEDTRAEMGSKPDNISSDDSRASGTADLLASANWVIDLSGLAGFACNQGQCRPRVRRL